MGMKGVNQRSGGFLAIVECNEILFYYAHDL